MEKNTDKQGNEVSREAALFFILGVKKEDVLSVYSGRCGCMCGCLGNHRYNPLHKDEASKDRGYAVDDEDCSARSISIILNKVRKEYLSTVALQDGYIIHVRDEERNRQYAVYVRESLALGA